MYTTKKGTVLRSQSKTFWSKFLRDHRRAHQFCVKYKVGQVVITWACVNDASVFDKGQNVCKEDMQAGSSVHGNNL